MIVTASGIDFERLDPELAHLMGTLADLADEACKNGQRQIEPLHFLVWLAAQTGSILNTDLLRPNRLPPERFREHLYVRTDAQRTVALPRRTSVESLSDASRKMMDDFEQRITHQGLERGNEALFLLTLFDHLPTLTRHALETLAGSPEAFARFCAQLERRTGPPEPPVELLDSARQETLSPAAFEVSGRRVIDRLAEETASMGCPMAGTLHLLYALAGIQNGVLQRGLYLQGIDPMRDVHAPLTRQLARPGARRPKDFALCRRTLHEPLIEVLGRASTVATRERRRITEAHLAQTLLEPRSGIVIEFLVGQHVNTESLRNFVKNADSEIEDLPEHSAMSMAEVEADLKRRILGQEDAIDQILPWIQRLRERFPRDRGPAAVLMFLGPSGTGKTQLAKELAHTVYGSDEALLMLEMGQFAARESINIFIGAPPGYVGYGQGKLTNGLRDKPECVVLFDEIEKAHEDVWVALLRFLDEGLIDDPAGPTRDGRRCIIVLTSNLGADELADSPFASQGGSHDDAGGLAPELDEQIRQLVLPYLKRPEIYNRVDDKVVFRGLTSSVYTSLIERAIDTERRNFAERYGTNVRVDSHAILWLRDRAQLFQKEGARCVPRLVNRFVVSPVLTAIVDNDGGAPHDVVVEVRPDGRRLVARKAGAPGHE